MSKVGVIVGRFQVDMPHQGHSNLIEEVHKRHGKVLICLGCSSVQLSAEDPLDYPTRARMMQSAFPWATIMPIHDTGSDQEWSKRLDKVISQAFPNSQAILYGSRDSFVGHYFGKWPIVELETVVVPSATETREEIAQNIRDSADFRAGVIYACTNRRLISHQTIDVAILMEPENGKGEAQVLLCRKPAEKCPRFIGGFLDPSDKNFEVAVRREVNEEAHVEIGGLEFLGSFRIDDWRYRGHGDKILTAFYLASYVFGKPQADDDIAELIKVPISKIPEILVDEHKELGQRLVEYLKERKGEKNEKHL
ncbi:MAG TPA: NUDIX domain-containing protein [Candidatus Paceibacterota bacterium]